ncbi:MAG: hypothetical protein ACK47B_21485 [Armatimonadota bacterium]
MKRLAVWGAAAVLALLGVAGGRGQAAAPRELPVVVVDAPLAGTWLRQNGTPHVSISAEALPSRTFSGPGVMVLPLESIRSHEAVGAVERYVRQGGRVVATYWGTLAGPESDLHPVYDLCELLGVRPAGWRYDEEAELEIRSRGVGALPRPGAKLRLSDCMQVVAEPIGSTLVAARWTKADGASAAPSAPAAAFVNGRVFYFTSNLFRPDGDTSAEREAFFWALQRIAPDLGVRVQARDRLYTASAAVRRLEAGGATPEARAARAVVDDARQAFAAKDHAQAIRLADRAAEMADLK